MTAADLILMFNKHSFINLLLIPLGVLFLSTIIVGCGGDNDGKDDPQDRSKVVGTWYGNDYDTFFSNVTITFNQDGTGTATIDHSGRIISISRAHFTYKVKGNVVTTSGTLVRSNSDGDTYTENFNNRYEIAGNYLNVIDGSNWYTASVQSYRK